MVILQCCALVCVYDYCTTSYNTIYIPYTTIIPIPTSYITMFYIYIICILFGILAMLCNTVTSQTTTRTNNIDLQVLAETKQLYTYTTIIPIPTSYSTTSYNTIYIPYTTIIPIHTSNTYLQYLPLILTSKTYIIMYYMYIICILFAILPMACNTVASQTTSQTTIGMPN